jgi:hypothetical protein
MRIKYQNLSFPNENYRLLSIFKFLNIIEYFRLTNIKLTKIGWCLYEMIPKFKNAKTRRFII